MKLQLAVLAGMVLSAGDAHERWMKNVSEAHVLWKNGQVPEARAAFERALEPAAELAQLGDKLAVPATHSYLAEVHAVTGRLDRSEWYALAGLREIEGVKDESSWSIEGKLRMSLGVAYYRTGRQPAGESELLRAIALYRKCKNIDPSEGGLTLINIATPRESASLAFAHEGLGILHLNAHRYAEAEKEFSTALGIMSRVSGDKTPEIAWMLELRAHALTKTKRKKEAQADLRQAREIREKAGPNWNRSSISVRALGRGK